MNRKREKPKFSNLRLRSSKTVASSPHMNEKISKYFPKISQESSSQKDDSAESQKESDIEETEELLKPPLTPNAWNMSVSDDSCFRASKGRVKKQLKLFTSEKTRAVKRKVKTNKSSTISATENGEVNLDHLQLAVAMSKSLQDMEGPVSVEESDILEPAGQEPVSTDNNIEDLKRILEQYGVSSNVKCLRSSVPKPAYQKRKKIKYLRTVLMFRTDEDRRKIIEDKVSQIMSNIDQYNEYIAKISPQRTKEMTEHKPGSFTLRELYEPSASLFKRSNLTVMEDAVYYNNLVDPKDSVKIGSLLKNWHAIPGREKTPPRITNDIHNLSENIVHLTPDLNVVAEDSVQEKHSNQTISAILNSSCDLSPKLNQTLSRHSPELFSDDSYVIQNKANRKSTSFERRIFDEDNNKLSENSSKECNNLKEHDISGDIFHYESYNDDVCFDLTKSSNSSPTQRSEQTEEIGEKFVDLTVDEMADLSHKDEHLNVPRNVKRRESELIKNDELTVTQILNTQEEKVVDLTQSSKESEVDINEIMPRIESPEKNNETSQCNESVSANQVICNDSKIKDLINVFNNSQSSNCEQSQVVISKNFDVSELGDLCDALMEDDGLNDKSFKHISDESTTDQNIMRQEIINSSKDLNISQSVTIMESHNSIEQKIDCNVTYISSDDEVFGVSQSSMRSVICDEELNYSSCYSARKARNILSSESETDEPVKINHSYLKKKSSSDFSSSENESEHNSSGQSIKSTRTKHSSSENEREHSITYKTGHNLLLAYDGLKEHNFNYDSTLKMSHNDVSLSDTEVGTVQEISKKDLLKNNILNLTLEENKVQLINGEILNDLNNSKTQDNFFNQFGNEKSVSPNTYKEMSDSDLEIFLEENSSPVKNNVRKSQKLLNDSVEQFLREHELKKLNKEMTETEMIQKYKEPPLIENDINNSLNQLIEEDALELLKEIDHGHSDNESDVVNTKNQVLKHPRITELSNFKTNLNKSNKIFDESLEKLLEENDPWISDGIENHSENLRVESCRTPHVQRESPVLPVTPDENLIIKTRDVTPMANYNQMDTPERNKELDKYGIKPMKRAKSVKILEYIYNATHPISTTEKGHVSSSDDEENREVKRRKISQKEKFISNSQVRKRRSQQPQYIATSERINNEINIAGDLISENDAEEDLIFERKTSKRILSCPIPFHIAWYNYISSQPEILQNILLYEPLQIEEIYLHFKNLGFKFHIEDIMTFLDKKCITIRTSQTGSRTKKRRAPKK